jgi:hypothetical protein
MPSDSLINVRIIDQLREGQYLCHQRERDLVIGVDLPSIRGIDRRQTQDVEAVRGTMGGGMIAVGIEGMIAMLIGGMVEIIGKMTGIATTTEKTEGTIGMRGIVMTTGGIAMTTEETIGFTAMTDIRIEETNIMIEERTTEKFRKRKKKIMKGHHHHIIKKPRQNHPLPRDSHLMSNPVMTTAIAVVVGLKML